MATDADRVGNKIAHIREQVAAVRNLIQTRAQQEILGDPWILKGLKYSLQTAIEAMIDIAFHLAAKRFSRAPADAREAFRVLAEGGVVQRRNLPVYLSMVGFGNRIVHDYQEVSAERVHAVAAGDLGSFDEFCREMASVLDGPA